MHLHHHIYAQMMHERQRDLLREGEARRARAAIAATRPAEEPDALAVTAAEQWRAQARPAADCRPA